MTRHRSPVLAWLSVLPPLGAAVAWYSMGGAGVPGLTPPGGKPLPEAFDAGHWVRNLLPPVVLLLPVLPVVLIGRELGRRHREDYTAGVIAIGLTLCGVALAAGALFDFGHTPRGRLAGFAERAGRTAEVVAPVVVALALGTAWVAAVDRRRTEKERRRQWICVSCGYSLRGNPWRCPECGRTYVPMSAPPKESAAER